MNIVITGGSSGIGLELAKILSKNKQYQVIIGSRRIINNPDFESLELDLSQTESINIFVSKIKNKFQKVDLLINNAGYGIVCPIADLKKEQMIHQFATNVFGPIELISGLLSSLQGGHVVNISSISQELKMPFKGIYSASKAAFDTISEILRLELFHKKIRVTTVRAGLVDSHFAQNALDQFKPKSSDQFQHLHRQISELNSLMPKMTSPRVFAEKLITKILSPKCAPIIYLGQGSFFYPLLIKILPYSIQLKIITKKFKLR